MADQKISELNEKTTLHDTDFIPIVDIEAELDETKKITGANLRNAWRKIQDADGDTLVEAEEDQVTMDVAGVEAFNLNPVLTLAKQSFARAYISSTQKIPTSSYIIPKYDTEVVDIQNEFNCSIASSTATAGTSGTTLKDSTNPFVVGDVGKSVWNNTDGGWTTIAAYVAADEVTLTGDINIDSGDSYSFGYARYTVSVDGVYLIVIATRFDNTLGTGRCLTKINKNAAAISSFETRIGAASSYMTAIGMGIYSLVASDYIQGVIWHNTGSTENVFGSLDSYIAIYKLA